MELVKSEEIAADPVTLEEVLDELCRFGTPRVCKHDSGWYSAIDMHVSSVGASFKVAAGFDHTTALEAATICLTRVRKAIKDLAIEA